MDSGGTLILQISCYPNIMVQILCYVTLYLHGYILYINTTCWELTCLVEVCVLWIFRADPVNRIRKTRFSELRELDKIAAMIKHYKVA